MIPVGMFQKEQQDTYSLEILSKLTAKCKGYSLLHFLKD